MAKKKRNFLTSEDRQLANRFQELVTLAMDRLGCKYRNKLVRVMRDMGIAGIDDDFEKQLDKESVPHETTVRRLVELMQQVGVTINIGYVLYGQGAGKGKKGKSLILEDKSCKQEDATSEDEELFKGITELELNMDTNEDIFDLPKDSEGDAVPAKEDDSAVLEEDIVETKVLDDDEEENNATAEEEPKPEQEPEAVSEEQVESQGEEPVAEAEQQIGVQNEEASPMDAETGARTAYQQWCDDAKALGIKEIDDAGMSCMKDGVTYVFAPAESYSEGGGKTKELPYRQMIYTLARNGLHPKKTINYKDDRVEWIVSVTATFSADIKIEAPTKEKAEKKFMALGAFANIGGRQMSLVNKEGVASSPRKL